MPGEYNMTMQIFEDVPLTIEDDEPWVADEDLARALGYAHPRDIRKLIARHLPFLPGIQSRATVARQSTNRGGVRTFTVTQYVLNESHALYISAKSNTLQANQLLQKVVAAFLSAKKFVRGLLTKSREEAIKELEELRQMYRQDMEAKEQALSAVPQAGLQVVVPRPGQRTMITITNHVDTSDGKRLFEVQQMFGLPTKNKHAGVVRDIAQKLNVWDNPEYMYITGVDTRGGDTFSRPSRKYKPIAIQKMAHTIIRKARELGYSVPLETIRVYGDPDLVRASIISWTNGVPTLAPVRRQEVN